MAMPPEKPFLLRHSDTDVPIYREAGYRPELAWSCHAPADMLLARDAAGDRYKASVLIDDGLSSPTSWI